LLFISSSNWVFDSLPRPGFREHIVLGLDPDTVENVGHTTLRSW